MTSKNSKIRGKLIQIVSLTEIHTMSRSSDLSVLADRWPSVIQKLDETGRKDASASGIVLNVALHPVLVFRLFDGDDQNFTFAE